MIPRLLSSAVALLAVAVLAGCGRSKVELGLSPPVVAAADAPAESSPSDASAARPGPKPATEEKSAPPTNGDSFAFPEDRGGKLLGKLLPPSAPPGLHSEPAKPMPRQVPPALANPGPPLPPPHLVPPRVVLAPGLDLKPIPLPERIPLDLSPRDPALPSRVEMPVGPLSKSPAPDVKQPAELPILAKPTPDRASLGDPTTEFTARSVVSAPLPVRTTPAPFVKVVVPDPFENAEAVKLRLPVEEDPTYALGNPAPPRR